MKKGEATEWEGNHANVRNEGHDDDDGDENRVDGDIFNCYFLYNISIFINSFQNNKFFIIYIPFSIFLSVIIHTKLSNIPLSEIVFNNQLLLLFSLVYLLV